jgi:hypothetical protein
MQSAAKHLAWLTNFKNDGNYCATRDASLRSA